MLRPEIPIEGEMQIAWAAIGSRRLDALLAITRLLKFPCPRRLRADLRLICRALCTDKNEFVRVQALEILEQVGNQQDTFAIVERLGDESWIVQVTAADALGEIRTQRAYRALHRSLSDPTDFVRRHVAGAMGRYRRKDLIPVLESL